MSPEERGALRLPADFGGASKSIYHRAVKKVYGRDGAGPEVLQALQECPGVAVPVVLPRLKQKNEEWRRAQRDWNRVWREVDARNFFKSLDHQGITFKANDKKNITAKSFVTELESAKAEAGERTQSAWWHLEYEMHDIAVLQDAMKLVFSFLDRSQAQYSTPERRGVERLLRSFVPLLFMLPVAEFDAAFGPPMESVDGEDAGEECGAADTSTLEDAEDRAGSGSGSGSRAAVSGGRRSAGGTSGAGNGGGVPPNDLRKKLLKTAQANAAIARSASASRHPSPTSDDAPGPSSPRVPTPSRKSRSARHADGNEDADDGWWTRLMPVDVDAAAGFAAEDARLGRDGITDQRPFFANTTFYTLLRLLQVRVPSSFLFSSNNQVYPFFPSLFRSSLRPLSPSSHPLQSEFLFLLRWALLLLYQRSRIPFCSVLFSAVPIQRGYINNYFYAAALFTAAAVQGARGQTRAHAG